MAVCGVSVMVAYVGVKLDEVVFMGLTFDEEFG